jgi:hypothetical protein
MESRFTATGGEYLGTSQVTADQKASAESTKEYLKNGLYKERNKN